MGKSQIEVESYGTQLRMETENCREGGQDVGFIQNVDYVVYKSVDFEVVQIASWQG